MSTEGIDPRFVDLDLWETGEAIAALYEAQVEAVAAVRAALPAVAAAVDAAAERLKQGGRVIYVGAGTSGRLGALDAAELLPTFDWPSERAVTLLAGGEEALTRAIEGAEDSSEEGAAAVVAAEVNAADIVIGIAASGATPFTLAAMEEARARRALTIGIANNKNAPLLRASEHAILIESGAEPIAGSTRLKAGTTQKVVLNLLSTEMMVRLGRIHRGMMVHMRPTNAKLRRRAEWMVATLADVDASVAQASLIEAESDVKLAVLMAKGLAKEKAIELLKRSDGNLRIALGQVS